MHDLLKNKKNKLHCYFIQNNNALSYLNNTSNHHFIFTVFYKNNNMSVFLWKTIKERKIT